MLIEQNVHSYQDTRMWKITTMKPFPGRDEALAEAAYAARWYIPQHPAYEKGRAVFHNGAGEWTVWVEGKLQDFHFRVSVTQGVGWFPRGSE